MVQIASLLVLGSAVASQLVAAHTATGTTALRQHRRELLKTLYARQDYPIGTTAPSCEAGFDTPTADGCECGPGREESGNLCVTSLAAAGAYNTYQAPATPVFAVSNTKRYTGPDTVLDNNQCAAIALTFADAKGYYIQPSATDGNNDCWVIGDATASSPPFFAGGYDGLPFEASNPSSKRAVPDAVTGTVGNGSGTIGYNGAIAAAPGDGTCDTNLGDSQDNTGACTCAPGRVNASPTTCRTTASAAARLRRAAAMKNASW